MTSVNGLSELSTRGAFDAAGSGWFRDGSFARVRTASGAQTITVNH